MSEHNKYRGRQEERKPQQEMHVVSIVSEHKKRSGHDGLGYTFSRPAQGMKRVEALVRFGSSKRMVTRHIDVAR